MTSKKVVSKRKSVSKRETAVPAEGVQQVWLASLGAVSLARKQGNELVEQVLERTQAAQAQTTRVLQGIVVDVQSQVEDAVGKVVASAQENLTWVGDKVETEVSKFLSRVGVPNRADIQELSERVAELNKQVRALKLKRAA